MGEDDQGPGRDEIELSVFGPGFGECLLLHLGHGDWLIVDSCIDQRNRKQPALDYLHQIGVDAAQAVKVIVTTHWHDDHIRGLAEVVSTCTSALFFCPAALLKSEVLVLLGIHRKGPRRENSGVREITTVFETLRDRSSGKTPRISLAVPNRVLFNESRSEGGRAQMVALSPSDAAVLRATLALTGHSHNEWGRLSAAPAPNLCAVVLHVSFPGGSLLLGSDLEGISDPAVGWTAVLDLAGRPTARAQVFKIPHHGSKNGHHDRVWSEMLQAPIYAALTPFVRVQTPLPTDADIDRITELTDHAYITSLPRRARAARRDPVVERQIREVALRMDQAEPAMGQVRFRRPFGTDLSAEWSVDLRGAARRLDSAS